MQWWENGARVNDEFAGADHRYRDELIDLRRADEPCVGGSAHRADLQHVLVAEMTQIHARDCSAKDQSSNITWRSF